MVGCEQVLVWFDQCAVVLTCALDTLFLWQDSWSSVNLPLYGPHTSHCQVDSNTSKESVCNSVQGRHVGKRCVEHNPTAIKGEPPSLHKAIVDLVSNTTPQSLKGLELIKDGEHERDVPSLFSLPRAEIRVSYSGRPSIHYVFHHLGLVPNARICVCQDHDMILEIEKHCARKHDGAET